MTKSALLAPTRAVLLQFTRPPVPQGLAGTQHRPFRRLECLLACSFSPWDRQGTTEEPRLPKRILRWSSSYRSPERRPANGADSFHAPYPSTGSETQCHMWNTSVRHGARPLRLHLEQSVRLGRKTVTRALALRASESPHT